jgi:hypothetical protein
MVIPARALGLLRRPPVRRLTGIGFPAMPVGTGMEAAALPQAARRHPLPPSLGAAVLVPGRPSCSTYDDYIVSLRANSCNEMHVPSVDPKARYQAWRQRASGSLPSDHGRVNVDVPPAGSATAPRGRAPGKGGEDAVYASDEVTCHVVGGRRAAAATPPADLLGITGGGAPSRCRRPPGGAAGRVRVSDSAARAALSRLTQQPAPGHLRRAGAGPWSG